MLSGGTVLILLHSEHLTFLPTIETSAFSFLPHEQRNRITANLTNYRNCDERNEPLRLRIEPNAKVELKKTTTRKDIGFSWDLTEVYVFGGLSSFDRDFMGFRPNFADPASKE